MNKCFPCFPSGQGFDEELFEGFFLASKCELTSFYFSFSLGDGSLSFDGLAEIATIDIIYS
jgi:hypothetical protein